MVLLTFGLGGITHSLWVTMPGTLAPGVEGSSCLTASLGAILTVGVNAQGVVALVTELEVGEATSSTTNSKSSISILQ